MNIDFEPWKILYSCQTVYSVKLLSNHLATLSPQNFENMGNVEVWGLSLVAYN